MGNQQILLIVLGMVIIGVTISVAIVLVNENAVTANRDAMSTDIVNIATRAQQYYNTPTAFGGGGRSYVGLSANAAGMSKLVSAAQSNSGNGTYTILVAGSASQVILQGVGNVELSDGTFPTLYCVIRPGQAQVQVIN
ncbi:MAG: hypothetical protein F9K22_11070 [Bacteroidetes bacterium]|nr:MAG: hypothetical protein F9K22_11070 [Bacteroidota bacterium]